MAECWPPRLLSSWENCPEVAKNSVLARIDESRSSAFAPVSASFVCRRRLSNSSFCPQVVKSRALTASRSLCNAYAFANGSCKSSSTVLQCVSKSRQMELTSSWESSAGAWRLVTRFASSYSFHYLRSKDFSPANHVIFPAVFLYRSSSVETPHI